MRGCRSFGRVCSNFTGQRSVVAPFAGTVVYRHPTPALVEDGKVILALAKGPGFLATVQLPAREASMLVPGQELRMKLKHSLVSEEVTGRLQSVQPVPGYPDRRDLLIECNLPPSSLQRSLRERYLSPCNGGRRSIATGSLKLDWRSRSCR